MDLLKSPEKPLLQPDTIAPSMLLVTLTGPTSVVVFYAQILVVSLIGVMGDLEFRPL